MSEGHWNRFRPPVVEPQPQPATADEIESAQTLTVHFTEGSGAHQLLQAIYRDDTQPLSRRIRCAVAALPFEVPKVSVAAGGPNRDFASRLEATIARSRGQPTLTLVPSAEGRCEGVRVQPQAADDGVSGWRRL